MFRLLRRAPSRQGETRQAASFLHSMIAPCFLMTNIKDDADQPKQYVVKLP
jgi:hypothetical protein